MHFRTQDAHWAGDASVDWSSSKWKGYGCNTGFSGKSSKSDGEHTPPSSQQQVPLEEEIGCIFDSFTNECLIYIDDFDQIDPATNKGLGNQKFKGQDWSHLDFGRILNHIASRMVHTQNLGGKQLLIKLSAVEGAAPATSWSVQRPQPSCNSWTPASSDNPPGAALAMSRSSIRPLLAPLLVLVACDSPGAAPARCWLSLFCVLGALRIRTAPLPVMLFEYYRNLRIYIRIQYYR